jgi:hypothetical protein
MAKQTKTLRPYEAKATLDTDVLTILKLAKKNNTGYDLTEDHIELFKRKISGYYDLTDLEIRTLGDFLGSETAQGIIDEAVQLIEYLDDEGQRKCLAYVCNKLYEAMQDCDLKKKIRPETMYETIMNLGVITVKRSARKPEIKKPIPLHLLKFSPDLAAGVIKRYLLKKLETMPINDKADFQLAEVYLRQEYERLMKYAK